MKLKYAYSLFMYASIICFELPNQAVRASRNSANGSKAQKFTVLPATSRKVGIIVQGPPVKGIFRDAECLVWALTAESSRPNTHTHANISIFYTDNYALLDQVRSDVVIKKYVRNMK